MINNVGPDILTRALPSSGRSDAKSEKLSSSPDSSADGTFTKELNEAGGDTTSADVKVRTRESKASEPKFDPRKRAKRESVESASAQEMPRLPSERIESAPIQTIDEPLQKTQSPVSESASEIPDQISGPVATQKPIGGKPGAGEVVPEKAPPAAAGAAAISLAALLNSSDPEVAEQAAVAVDGAIEQQGQVKRKALEEFVTSMNREFGVSNEEIVKAFSKMDEKTLMAPAEESTKAFLSNLEVPVKQAPRVAELYKTMVRTTGEAALNEKLIGIDSGVNMSVVTPREQALQQLNVAIDELNDAFAMRGQPVVSTTTGEGNLKAQLAAEQMNARLMQMQQMQAQQMPGRPLPLSATQANLQEESSDSNRAIMAGAGGRAGAGFAASESTSGMTNGASAGPAASTSPTMPFSMPSSDAGLSGGGEFSSFMNGQEARAGQSGAESAAIPFEAPLAGQETAMNSPSATSALAAPVSEAKSSVKKSDVKSARTTEVPADAAAADPSLVAGQAPAAKPAGPGPEGMILARPTPTPKDEQENVKELIRQAQVVIKNGGGEVKMDLKPEGMGQVRLKVTMENGQVNVQMLTENDASKRLLERGLDELKSNLAAQQLKVENLKVDVGQELQKHMDKGGDQQREQARQFAADVMSQFRDERQAFQQGFMENRGWKQYPRPENRAPVEPESATQAVAARASAYGKRAGSSSRLNVVA